MSFDSFQRAVLAELGHVLHRLSVTTAPDVASARPEVIAAMQVDEEMLARLARAAGLSPEALRMHADVAAQSAGLRGDVAAKRALWPRLRTLRAGRS